MQNSKCHQIQIIKKMVQWKYKNVFVDLKSYIEICVAYNNGYYGTYNKKIKLKKRIRETLNLAACADSSTNTMKSRLIDTFPHYWALFSQLLACFGTFCDFTGTFCKKKNPLVTCHISHIKCHMSRVTCQLLPVTKANSHRPLPANSPIIHSRLVPAPKKP